VYIILLSREIHLLKEESLNKITLKKSQKKAEKGGFLTKIWVASFAFF